MDILTYLKENIVILDGGMGTLLQAHGLLPGEYPEEWNLTHPQVIEKLHRDYYEAGSNVVNTNTFGANLLKFTPEKLREIIESAVRIAKAAKFSAKGDHERFVALDIGPTGKLLKPYGDLDFEEAVRIFAETVRIGASCGVDLIMIETMNDSYETKAALLAAKENSDLPVFVSNVYGEDQKLMTGASPAAMVAMLEGMGADAIGMNCSLGPKQLRKAAQEYLRIASVPVLLKPNAGLPKSENGKTVYDVSPEEFAREVCLQVKAGVRIAGGCCGTTPAYIRLLTEGLKRENPVPVKPKELSCVSSYTHAVLFGREPVLIGERINPTGKKRLKQALLEKDMDYILQEGIRQQEEGAHILDVNVGLPDINEAEMLRSAVCELQAVTDLPLQIDTSDVAAMEAALRRYNGKALINSVNGKEESMKAVFPLQKKYGGIAVALTLDENGIPETAEGRVAVAQKILDTAASYGIGKKDLIFDPLALTVSADPGAAAVTLEALRLIRDRLGCLTSLGVSNISFGLPSRDAVNGTYFALALQCGLSAAIMNPYSFEMMKTYHAFRVLKGMDANCAEYIAFSASHEEERRPEIRGAAAVKTEEEGKTALQRAIRKGLKEQAAVFAAELLKTRDPLSLVREDIVPALDAVGKGFEEKTVYLPQLLMSAEAAKAAVEEIRKTVPPGAASQGKRFILATVQGDIHDIGKNIVKLLLENYGYDVIDLGKDVPPEVIVETVLNTGISLVGLSALMTTTVPAMEETIRQLREKAPRCRVVVGGAVLNEEYARRIGADQYARDAMETVRYAESIIGRA